MQPRGEALCFDDILLVPQHSAVISRFDVDLKMDLGNGVMLDFPVIASPMDTICEIDMARAIGKRGGLGIIHRYLPLGKQNAMVHELFAEGISVGAAVGATGNYLTAAETLYLSGAKVILVDTANGHSEYAARAVTEIRTELGEKVHIMAGNVSTIEGYLDLSRAGADSVRVGIGGGSCCTTRLVSGHGVPTLHSIMDCNRAKYFYEDSLEKLTPRRATIVADGGIRNSGDMVKAFAAGADAVMVGSMLAGTEETPGDSYNGRKHFRGMASASAQKDWRGNVPLAEGIATTVPERGSANDVFQEVRGGLGSGCSYSGVAKLSELSDHSMYFKVTRNSVKESSPHARETQ